MISGVHICPLMGRTRDFSDFEFALGLSVAGRISLAILLLCSSTSTSLASKKETIETCVESATEKWILDHYPQKESSPRRGRNDPVEISHNEILPADEDMRVRNRLPLLYPFYIEDLDAATGPSDQGRYKYYTSSAAVSVAGGAEALPSALGPIVFPFPTVVIEPRPLTQREISSIVAGGDSKRPLGAGGARRVYVLAGTEGLDPQVLIKIPHNRPPRDQLTDQAIGLAFQRSREMGLMEGLQQYRERIPEGMIETGKQFQTLNRDTRIMLQELGIATYEEYLRVIASGRMQPLEDRRYDMVIPFSTENQFQTLPKSTRSRLAAIGIHSLEDATRMGLTLVPRVIGTPLGQWVAENPYSLDNAGDYHAIYSAIHRLVDLNFEIARMVYRRFGRYLANFEYMPGNEYNLSLAPAPNDHGDHRQGMAARPLHASRDQETGKWMILRVNGVDFGPSNLSVSPRDAFNNIFVVRDARGRLRIVVIDI